MIFSPSSRVPNYFLNIRLTNVDTFLRFELLFLFRCLFQCLISYTVPILRLCSKIAAAVDDQQTI